MKIQFVAQEDIDRLKWDSCVHYANNGNVFGYSWYLNNVAKEWDALVEDDYTSVFPLIWRQKYWNVKELYQPLIMQQTGIYSVQALSYKRVQAFIDAIPEDLKLVNVHLNHQNNFKISSPWKLSPLDNYHLYLNATYDTVVKDYSPSVLQKLEQAKLAQLRPVNSLKPEKIVDFYKKYTHDTRQLDRRYHQYLRIMYNVLHRSWGFASGVENAKGDLVAVGFFIYSHGKVMHLLSAASPEGRSKAADVYLLDMLIRTHAGRPTLLDFNGNDPIAEVFGAKKIQYQQLQKDSRKWGIF